jgi:hypothetical protein
VLKLTMNDLAVEALGGSPFSAADAGPEPLAPGLRRRLAVGIERRGAVLVWRASAGRPDAVPGPTFPDLTGWECGDSSFHIEDFAPVQARLVDDVPRLGEAAQSMLLRQGIAFAAEFALLVRGLGEPRPVRVIIGVGTTGGTLRFHQIREGEDWIAADLDGYVHEKVAVLDIVPPPSRASERATLGLRP